MNKQKRKHRTNVRAHTTHFPQVGLVQLAPSRESLTPFCSYYGPNGATCPITTGLETVFTLPSSPPYTYMACPLHYDAVSHMVQAFLTQLDRLSRQM